MMLKILTDYLYLESLVQNDEKNGQLNSYGRTIANIYNKSKMLYNTNQVIT